LKPFGVALYDDYDKMIQQPGLDAVVIGTATSVHAEEAVKAMEKNLHVLCEKPLSTNISVGCSFSSLSLRLPITTLIPNSLPVV
jgi:myo-inositol 2-dehydrogenase/D-chiro-inositol 1-dehydrogenase